jgi:hypothetical protein
MFEGLYGNRDKKPLPFRGVTEENLMQKKNKKRPRHVRDRHPNVQTACQKKRVYARIHKKRYLRTHATCTMELLDPKKNTRFATL